MIGKGGVGNVVIFVVYFVEFDVVVLSLEDREEREVYVKVYVNEMG